MKRRAMLSRRDGCLIVLIPNRWTPEHMAHVRAMQRDCGCNCNAIPILLPYGKIDVLQGGLGALATRTDHRRSMLLKRGRARVTYNRRHDADSLVSYLAPRGWIARCNNERDAMPNACASRGFFCSCLSPSEDGRRRSVDSGRDANESKCRSGGPGKVN